MEKNNVILSILSLCYIIICTFNFFILLGVFNYTELNILFTIAIIIALPITFINLNSVYVLILLDITFIWSLVVCQFFDVFEILPSIIYTTISIFDIICIALITCRMGVKLCK